MLLAIQSVICDELSLNNEANWLATSTLIYKDLDYQQLGIALQLRQELELDTSMDLGTLSVYQME